MALVVEDGAGRADAESYVSLVAASAYHAKMGNAAWAAVATDDLREQALRRASRHMVAIYRPLWAGQRATATQALDWPRYDVVIRDAPGGIGNVPAYYPPDVVPTAVVEACCELALRTATGTDLLADLGRTVKSRKIGPIETTYEDSAPENRRFPLVDSLIAPLLRSGGVNVGRLTRS